MRPWKKIIHADFIIVGARLFLGLLSSAQAIETSTGNVAHNILTVTGLDA